MIFRYVAPQFRIVGLAELQALHHAGQIDQQIAIDTEFFGMDKDRLHYEEGTFAAMSACLNDDTVLVILDEDELEPAFQILNEYAWVMQNALFDIRHLRRYVDIPKRVIYDTMLIEQALFGGYYSHSSLSAMSARWLGMYVNKDTRTEFSEVEVMTEDMIKYSAGDAFTTKKIMERQLDYIIKNNLTDKVMNRYYHVDEPMIWVILGIRDVPIDVDNWDNLVASFQETVKPMQEELGFNVNSWAQLRKQLTEQFGIRDARSDAEGLQEYIDSSSPTSKLAEFCQKVLDIKSYSKMISTYGRTWLDRNVDPVTHTVRSNWKINGALTGRMASANPNLQNIPSRGKEFAAYRKMFKSYDGESVIVADISQQEPRITAFSSGDKAMLKIFEDGADFHSRVAMLVFKPEDVEGELDHSHPLRTRAKSIGLGLAYNMSFKMLAAKLKVSVEMAKDIHKAYFAAFPGVERFLNQSALLAETKEYVETRLGKRCWISPYSHNVAGNAVNYHVQGTAAEQTKLALAYLYSVCEENNLLFPVILVVHDEIVLSVPDDTVDFYIGVLGEAFKYAGEMTIPGVPMVVEFGVGKDWSAKE